MFGRHKVDTMEFRVLSFAEQAESIAGTIDDLHAAMELHVEHSPRQLETIEACLAQVDRLRHRLRSAYEQQSTHPESGRSVPKPRRRRGSAWGAHAWRIPSVRPTLSWKSPRSPQMPAYDGRHAPCLR